MNRQATAIYLKEMLGISVKTLGFLGLMKDNCAACSKYPDEIEPAYKLVGELVDRIDRLATILEGKENGVC